MEMQNDKNRENVDMGETVNGYLNNIGLIDTVDAYLNSDTAHTIIKTAYDNWMFSLKEFVDKLPEFAKMQLMRVMKEDMGDLEENIYRDFKSDLSEAIMALESYVSIENLVVVIIENTSREQMWDVKLYNLCKQFFEVLDETVKIICIGRAVFAMEDSDELQKLDEILANEPNGSKLMSEIYAEAQNVGMTLLDGIFG